MAAKERKEHKEREAPECSGLLCSLRRFDKLKALSPPKGSFAAKWPLAL